MTDTTDVIKRIARLEAEQDGLKTIQAQTVDDIRQTTDSLRVLASDVTILVNNVAHLTSAIEKLSTVVDQTHQIQMDLVLMKERTSKMAKLWSKVDTISDNQIRQEDVYKIVKRGVYGALTLLCLALVGTVLL